MCYERWIEREQVTEALRKARNEAEKIIEQAKSPPARPEPEPGTRPSVEHEQAA